MHFTLGTRWRICQLFILHFPLLLAVFCQLQYSWKLLCNEVTFSFPQLMAIGITKTWFPNFLWRWITSISFAICWYFFPKSCYDHVQRKEEKYWGCSKAAACFSSGTILFVSLLIDIRIVEKNHHQCKMIRKSAVNRNHIQKLLAHVIAAKWGNHLRMLPPPEELQSLIEEECQNSF